MLAERDLMPAKTSPQNLIAFQGEQGAYSDLACRQVFPRRHRLAPVLGLSSLLLIRID